MLLFVSIIFHYFLVFILRDLVSPMDRLLPPSNGPLIIGNYNGYDDTFSAFPGCIDDVALWSIQLSDTDVYSLFTTTRPDELNTQPEAFYSFDDIQAGNIISNISDISLNNNTIVLSLNNNPGIILSDIDGNVSLLPYSSALPYSSNEVMLVKRIDSNWQELLSPTSLAASASVMLVNSIVSTEHSRAVLSESNLFDTIQLEVSRATGQENLISDLVNTEQQRALAAENNIQSNLEMETNRSADVEFLMQTNYNKCVYQLNELNSTVLAMFSVISQQISKLQADLNAANSRAESAEYLLQQEINNSTQFVFYGVTTPILVEYPDGVIPGVNSPINFMIPLNLLLSASSNAIYFKDGLLQLFVPGNYRLDALIYLQVASNSTDKSIGTGVVSWTDMGGVPFGVNLLAPNSGASADATFISIIVSSPVASMDSPFQAKLMLITMNQVAATITTDSTITITRMPGIASSYLSLQPCAAGTYAVSTGNCLTCLASYYCPYDSEPITCPVGTYCPIGSITPIACSIGTYSSTLGASSISTCIICPIDDYCPNTGMTQPYKCLPGYYTPNTGNIICTICPAGSYCTGGANPIPSPSGSYSLLGASIPTYCPSGSWSTSTGATSSSTCVSCSVGNYCLGGNNITPCPSNTYLSTTGSSSIRSCLSCINGMSSVSGSSSCVCGPGNYFLSSSKTGSLICTLCSAGSISTTFSATYCTKCRPGYGPNSAHNACVECIPGTYSNGGCVQCSSGQYTTSHGSSECNECPSGSTSTLSLGVSCTACPAGSAIIGSDSDNFVCTLCSIGQYSTSPSSTSCRNCPKGTTTSATGSTSITSCLP
jgi:hypothetical protein